MTVHIIAKDAARAALARYEVGTLSAQAPTPVCRYRAPGGYACAIGAALTDEQLAALKAASPSAEACLGFQTTALAGLNGWTSDKARQLKELQIKHDSWASAAMDVGAIPEDSPDAAGAGRCADKARKAFLDYAGRLAENQT